MSNVYELATQLTESEALDLFFELRRHHGWQGTIFMESDLEDLWSELRRPEGMETGLPWSEVRENVLNGRYWTRWFTNSLAENGNEYLANWIVELSEDGMERA